MADPTKLLVLQSGQIHLSSVGKAVSPAQWTCHSRLHPSQSTGSSASLPHEQQPSSHGGA
eukprot:6597536-Prorocentrum_lima.AAC.1